MGKPDVVLHGDVWDALNGLRPDHWISVSDSCIETVSSNRPESADDEFEVAFLSPGLIDMHVHLVWDGSDDPVATLRRQSTQETVLTAVENAYEELIGGTTTVRDLGSTDDIAIAIADAIRGERIPGPRTYASGRTIIISGGHDSFWGIESDGADAVRSAVRKLRHNGADVIKVSATGGVYGQAVGEKLGVSELTAKELNAIVEEAHRFGLPVAAHAVGTTGIRNTVDACVDTVEHGNLMDKDTLKRLIEYDIAPDPTLFTYRNIALGDAAPTYAQENAQRVYERHGDVFAEAHEKEARILAGSDAGSPDLPHPSLHHELACLVEFGLDPESALEAATATSSAELGRPELGVIEAGTPADIVGYVRDPRDDITAIEQPELVVKDGAVYRSPGRIDRRTQ